MQTILCTKTMLGSHGADFIEGCTYEYFGVSKLFGIFTIPIMSENSFPLLLSLAEVEKHFYAEEILLEVLKYVFS